MGHLGRQKSDWPPLALTGGQGRASGRLMGDDLQVPGRFAIVRMMRDALPLLAARLEAATEPFREGSLLGVTSHLEVPARVAYGVHAETWPDGFVLAALLPRNTEQAYLLMRVGDRRLYWMARYMSPWSADAGPAARQSLEEALADWDRGARAVYVCDGVRRDWPDGGSRW